MFGGGFGNRTTSAFGQTSSFGKPTTSFASPGFGTSNTSLFGQTSQPATTSLFGSTTPTFGQTTTAQSFGGFGTGTGTNTSIFGAQQTAAGTPGTIFGAQNANPNPSGTGLFGSSTPATFGGNSSFGSFGASGNTGGSLFGQTQANPSQSTSLFGQNNTTGTGLFGGPSSMGTGSFTSGNPPVGTTIKFNPVTGNDQIVKNGVTQNINIKHHCITCMKEYESKSLEELRYEDYLANRKGPPQGTQAGTSLFGGGTQSTLFGGNASTSNATTGTLFGNSGFGQQNVFGQNTTMQNNTSLFGKPTSAPFGSTATTQTAGFGSTFGQSTSLFGATANQAKPAFGGTQSSGTGLFGTNPVPTSAFGTQNNSFNFNNTAQQPNQGIGLFGQPQNKFNTFSSTTPATSSFSFGSNSTTPAGSSLFGQKPATTGFGVTTTSSSFGTTPFGANTTASGGGLFSGGFNKPQTSGFSFGQNATAPTIAGTNMGGSSLFGNTAAKPAGGLFSNPGASSQSLFGGGFGSNTSFGGSTNTGFGSNLSFGGSTFNSGGTSLQNVSVTPTVYDQLQVLSVIPYGNSPLYKHVNFNTGKTDELLKPSVVMQKHMSDSNNFKVSTQINNIVTRKAHSYIDPAKKSLFDKIEGEIADSSHNQQRQSPRYLKLKPKSIINKNKLDKPEEIRVNATYTLKDLDNDIEEFMTKSAENTEQSRVENSSGLSPETNKNTSGFEGDTMYELNSQKRAPAARKHVTFSMNDITSPSHEESSSFANESVESDKENEQVTENERDHLCNVKLRRNDYFCVPSLSDLDDIVDDEGRCIVQNFTIGRHRYGNVTFYDAFDVSGLDLDTIVFFSHKEIEIYPNDEVKPPVGTGLNRRAQVTLDRVWPQDKSTREIIKEPERLKMLNFEDKLRRASAKMNARFIEYRHLTGSWVFEVEHFSKYGLDDSDEDDSNKATEKPIKTLSAKQPTSELKSIFSDKTYVLNKKRGLDGKMLYNNDNEMMTQFGFDEDDELMTLEEERPSLTPSSKNFPSEYDDFPSPTEKIIKNNQSSLHKVQLMKASFYVQDDISDAEISLEKGIPDLDLFATGHIDAYRSTGTPSKNILPLIKSQFTSQFPPPIDIPVTDFTEEEYKPPVFSPEVKAVSYKPHPMLRPQRVTAKFRGSVFAMERSITHLMKMSLCDSGLNFDRHFRIGWSKGLSFACLSSTTTTDLLLDTKFDKLGKLFMGRRVSDVSPNVINRLQLTTQLSEEFQNNVEEHLQICLRGSLLTYEDGVPVLQPERGVATLHEHCEVEQQTVRLEESYDRQVWELMVALWGNVPGLEIDSDIKTHKTRMLRKTALSSWLKNVIRATGNAQGNECDHISQVLSSLCCGEVQEACQLAIDNDDFNLALLISQLGGNEVTRSLMEQQLKQWHESEADQLIDVGRLKIITLVAGHMLYFSSKNVINTCENLDWEQAFALHLWYITRPSDSIVEALRQYEDALKLDERYAAFPVPPYVKNIEFETSSGDQVKNLCYHLLKLFARRSYPLESVLNPISHTANVLDYRLSWLVMVTLKSLGYNHLSEEAEYSIHTSFAAQLEVCGLWQWAIFVLLHIGDLVTRINCIKNCIDKNIQLSPDGKIGFTNEESFIHENLHVPAEWFFYSKAILAVSSNRHVEAAWYYIRAKCWNEAHDIIMNNLLTKAIINEKYGILRDMLSEIVASECILRGWNHRGAVIYDYLTIVDQVNTAVAHSQADISFLEELQPLLSSVCTKIKFFPTSTTKERLCQAEVSKRIIQLIRVILNLQYGKRGMSIRFIVSLIDQLPLPEDYKQQELQEIISWWIDK